MIKNKWVGAGLLALILLTGCATLRYYPVGDFGHKGSIPYYSDFDGRECYKCHEKVNYFKLDSKDRVVCMWCYRKLMKYDR